MKSISKGLALLCLLSGLVLLGQGGAIHAKAWLAQVLLEHAWQRTLQSGQPHRPWPWADTWPVSRLLLPERDTELIILAGDSGRSLAFAPGHHSGSALPGEVGNSLVSAHRDTHFAILRELRPGESLIVESPGGQRHRYTVDQARVVDQRRAYFLEQPDTARLHLVTCYPFDAIQPGGNLRYIVSASAGSAAF